MDIDMDFHMVFVEKTLLLNEVGLERSLHWRTLYGPMTHCGHQCMTHCGAFTNEAWNREPCGGNFSSCEA